jgi:hypothetical protein
MVLLALDKCPKAEWPGIFIMSGHNERPGREREKTNNDATQNSS